MTGARPAAAGASPRAVLFTDLDGTLLDFETYRPSRRAMEAVRRLLRCGVSIVPVSSKTAAEVRPLMAEMELEGPAVTEGGGVILDGGGRERAVGTRRFELIAVLEHLRRAGYQVRGMSEMNPVEVCARTGLELESARRAMVRQASEPFVCGGGGESLNAADLAHRLALVAAEHGASVVRGGRFWHLMGVGIDKGIGLREVLESLGETAATAAVGDAWNDLPMLAAVDRGFLLGDAVADADLPPGVTRIGGRGPAGFTAVAELLARDWCDSGEEFTHPGAS